RFKACPTCGRIRSAADGPRYNAEECCCDDSPTCECGDCLPGSIPAFVTVTLAGAVPLPAGLKYFPDVAAPAPGNTTSYYDHRFDVTYLEVNDDYELPCVPTCGYSDRFLLTTVTNGAHPMRLYL